MTNLQKKMAEKLGLSQEDFEKPTVTEQDKIMAQVLYTAAMTGTLIGEYSIIKRFYDLGVYSLAKVKDFVKAGVISPEQFKEITKEVYHEAEVSETH